MYQRLLRAERIPSPRLIKIWVWDEVDMPEAECREEYHQVLDAALDFLAQERSSIDTKRWIRRAPGDIIVRLGRRTPRKSEDEYTVVKDALLRRVVRQTDARCSHCKQYGEFRGRLFAYGEGKEPEPIWHDGLFCSVECFRAHQERQAA